MSDLTAGLVKGAAQAGAAIAKDIGMLLASKGVKEANKLTVTFEIAFQKFLDRNYKKFSRIKTLLNPSTPIALESVYEAPTVKVGGKILDEDQLLDLIESDKFLIITGLGGSGKSVLLKHFFVRYYNEGRGRIPFLVELRNLPVDQSLYNYMHNQLRQITPKFDSDLFEFAMRSGKFIFLLDAFDEIDEPNRSRISAEINDMVYSFGDNAVIVTSRPDAGFVAWSEFAVSELQGFNQSKVVSFVKKMKYENAVKKRFISLVKDGGAISHSSSLSGESVALYYNASDV